MEREIWRRERREQSRQNNIHILIIIRTGNNNQYRNHTENMDYITNTNNNMHNY